MYDSALYGPRPGKEDLFDLFGFLLGAAEMNGDSTRSSLRLRSVHRNINRTPI